MNVRGRRRSDSMQQMWKYNNNNNNNRKLISLIFSSPSHSTYFPFHSNDQQVGFSFYTIPFFFFAAETFFLPSNDTFSCPTIQMTNFKKENIFFSICFFFFLLLLYILMLLSNSTNKKYDMIKKSIVVCVCDCAFLSIRDTALRITEKWWYTEILLHKKESKKKNNQQHTYKYISQQFWLCMTFFIFFFSFLCYVCHVSKKKE